MTITWRSLVQPGNAGAGYLLQGAQRSLDSGFNALNNVLDQRNKTEASNWQTQKANNTTDYLNAVADVKDPAQLQDPQVQANLAAMKEQFGYQVDSQAIRGAADNRVQALQQQGLQRIEFNDKSRVDGERDQVDQIGALYRAGKYQEGDALRQGKNFRDDAVLDQLKVDAQRGYSQEGRAQAGESRAQQDQVWQGQDHALSQQVGRANLDFTNLQRKDLLATQDRTKAGNEMISGAVNGWTATQTNNAERIAQIAKDTGVPVVDGVPMLDNASDEQKATLKEALKGVTAPSSTQVLQTLDQQLRKDPRHFTEAEITAIKAGTDKGLSGTQALSTQDQEDLAAKGAALDAAALSQTAKEQDNWTKLQKSNVFLQSVEDPNVTIDDVAKSMKENQFDPVFFEGGNRDDVLKATTQIMTHGIEVDGQHYAVPPAMLKGAMAVGVNDWFNPAQGIKDSLEALIKANPQAYADSIGKLEEHKQNVRDINVAKIKANASYKAQAKGKAGIPFDVNQFMNKLQGTKP